MKRRVGGRVGRGVGRGVGWGGGWGGGGVDEEALLSEQTRSVTNPIVGLRSFELKPAGMSGLALFDHMLKIRRTLGGGTECSAVVGEIEITADNRMCNKPHCRRAESGAIAERGTQLSGTQEAAQEEIRCYWGHWWSLLLG
jgi:hypothetical protein